VAGGDRAGRLPLAAAAGGRTGQADTGRPSRRCPGELGRSL